MKPLSKVKAVLVKPIPKIFVLTVAFVVILAVGWLGLNYFSNYAEKTAKPLENALVKAGAVKQCSRGDNGRGWDNRAPWYYTIYEVPGDREEAASTLTSVASKKGYHLIKQTGTEDHLSYVDTSSQQVSYLGLEGNVSLSVDIYVSKTHNGEDGYLCGVTKNDSPPRDKTTIRVDISLPELDRYFN